jgi:small-conductance mechanosensitive channel
MFDWRWYRIRETLRDLDVELFTLGGSAFTLWSLARLVLLLILLFVLAGRIRRFVQLRLLARTQLDAGAQQTIGTLVRYLVLVLGGLAIVQNVGIDLTTFNVVAGALGVGIGFGLQNIFSNLVSGLIILFERPIRVGDRVELGPIEGRVADIGARRVTLVTNDNVAVIVPNQKFITDNVINLQYAGGRVRLHVPMGVAHGPDPRLVERLMLEAARDHPDVLDEPPPAVRLLSLGGPAMNMELLVWTQTMVHARRTLASQLNFAISARFRAHEIRHG